MTYQAEFIQFMVRSGVLTFGDFTTKSGRKTPYFINTGNYKTGAQADALGSYYAACMKEHLEEAGGAAVLLEEDSCGQAMFQAACGILHDDAKRASMEKAMASLGIRDATERIYQVILDITK